MQTDIRKVPSVQQPPRRPEVILASASPRRSELMALTGWSVEVRSGGTDETPRPGESGREMTRRLARAKAESVEASAAIVLAADTTVVDGAARVGKPVDAAEAHSMLVGLRGRSHTVVSSIAVRMTDGTMILDTCESSVPMRRYGDDEVDAYVASGEPFDKAGGYNIQDAGFSPVDLPAFRDCYANVMGLPLCHVVRTMRRAGLDAPVDVAAACMAHLKYDCPVSSSILRGAA